MLVNERRANEFLDKFGLSAFLSSSRENTTYLTNFLSVVHIYDRLSSVSPGGGESYLQTYGIFPKDKKPVLVIPVALSALSKNDMGITERAYYYGKSLEIAEGKTRSASSKRGKEDTSAYEEHIFDNAASALGAAVKEFAGEGSIGVDYSDLHPTSESVLNNLGVRLKNATELFKFMRMAKSNEELDRLRRVARVNENGLSKMLALMAPGVSEIDLMKEYSRAIVSEGAKFDPGYVLCTSGEQSGQMLYPTTRKLRKGDRVWIDVICSLNGYNSDTGESAVLGRPDPKQARIYLAMEEVIERAEQLVEPGMKPSVLLREVEPIWEKFGLQVPPVTLGHGIGLDVHEYPQISHAVDDSNIMIKDDLVSSTADIPFEEGMVLNLESAYMIRGWGGVHLERTVIVEKSKCSPLVKQHRSLRIR